MMRWTPARSWQTESEEQSTLNDGKAFSLASQIIGAKYHIIRNFRHGNTKRQQGTWNFIARNKSEAMWSGLHKRDSTAAKLTTFKHKFRPTQAVWTEAAQINIYARICGVKIASLVRYAWFRQTTLSTKFERRLAACNPVIQKISWTSKFLSTLTK